MKRKSRIKIVSKKRFITNIFVILILGICIGFFTSKSFGKKEIHTCQYTVASSDTLWNISKRYNTTVEELMMLNNLSNDLIMIGQELILPNTNVHIVKAGDTLFMGNNE